MLQGAKPEQKLSKDELIDQLQQQNKYLATHLQKQQEEGFFKRLDYLFKVVENAKLFIELDKDFVLKAVSEIVNTITIPEVKNPEVNIASQSVSSDINKTAPTSVLTTTEVK